MPFEITAKDLTHAFSKAAQTIAAQEILINKLRAELSETQSLAEKMLDVALEKQKERRTGVALLREVRDFANEGANRARENRIKTAIKNDEKYCRGQEVAYNAIFLKIDRLLDDYEAEKEQSDGV